MTTDSQQIFYFPKFRLDGILVAGRHHSVEVFSVLAMLEYSIPERIDGERGLRLVSYRLAEQAKIWLLNWI